MGTTPIPNDNGLHSYQCNCSHLTTKMSTSLSLSANGPITVGLISVLQSEAMKRRLTQNQFGHWLYIIGYTVYKMVFLLVAFFISNFNFEPYEQFIRSDKVTHKDYLKTDLSLCYNTFTWHFSKLDNWLFNLLSAAFVTNRVIASRTFQLFPTNYWIVGTRLPWSLAMFYRLLVSVPSRLSCRNESWICWQVKSNKYSRGGLHRLNNYGRV